MMMMVLDACVHSNEREKKDCGFEWVGKWGGVEGVEVVIRLQGVKKLFEKYIRPWD